MNQHGMGDAIRDLRVNRQLTQQQLALLVGVSNKAISKWENDEGMPDIENIKRLASVFNVSIDYLLGNSELQSKREVYSWEWLNLGLVLCSLLMLFLPFVSIDIGKIISDSLWGDFDTSIPGTYLWQSISGFRLVFDGLTGFSIQNGLILLSILGWFAANVIVIIWVIRGTRDKTRSLSIKIALVCSLIYFGVLLLMAVFASEIKMGIAPFIILILQSVMLINESKHKEVR